MFLNFGIRFATLKAALRGIKRVLWQERDKEG
jgi:hypothetical protein